MVLSCYQFWQHSPYEYVFDACRQEAKGLWVGGQPKEWYYAIPVGCVVDADRVFACYGNMISD